ncbi:MAG: sialate O-acetylesterase [Akkermansiaceae bacterium]
MRAKKKLCDLRYIVAWASIIIVPLAVAAAIPAQIPNPEGQTVDATKPVKVYILAGQSNMVGMGDLRGAKNLYNGIYLTSDPGAILGPLSIHKVGQFNIARLKTFRPDGTPTTEPIAKGHIEVPEKGVYEAQCGNGGNYTIILDGKEVFQVKTGGKPTTIGLPLVPGKKYTFEIIGAEKNVPRIWMEKTDLLGNGDLESVVKREGMFPWLLDEKGEWSVRQDVYFQEARVAKEGRGSLLSATSNGKSIGPELGFGHVLGTYHDEHVLLIKTAMGNRSLGFDFRPPSSGRKDPKNKWESLEYRLMVEGVRKTLGNIDKVIPGYKGQGYEIAGFAWFQGHKDSFSEDLITEYEQNLVNLIKDVRKEFKVPNLPAVVATVGFGGGKMNGKFVRILKAQMAVSDPEKYPNFKGQVASVDTRPFWRELGESPRNQDYHYHRNAETYMRIGDAMGRAMVVLKGGKAEILPQGPRPAPEPDKPAVEPSNAELAASKKAIAPIVLDGIIPSYIANSRYSKGLLEEVSQSKPMKDSQFLQRAMFGLVNCYHSVGIHDFDWKVVAPDLRDQEWNYFTFDPAEELPKDKPAPRYRDVTLPEGMENWFAPAFEPNKAGWKKGMQPFGQFDGKLKPLRECDRTGTCGCGETPKSLWEKEVLLATGTFDVPAIREGHRYRIVIGGSGHVNAGEGFALYVNGKLFTESKTGVGKRQGGQPRGGHVYADFRNEFKNGKVTISVKSFLRYSTPRGVIPPSGHLTVWIEEQKLPDVIELPSK